jgi:hypothetical protein
VRKIVVVVEEFERAQRLLLTCGFCKADNHPRNQIAGLAES